MRDVKQGLASGGPTLPSGSDGWEAAVALTTRWLARGERVDALLEGLAAGFAGQERARAQQLFYGVVRWAGRLESALTGLMVHAPRTKVRAILMVTGFELWEQGEAAPAVRDGMAAKIIHHAVGRAKTIASAPEARLVNAVARKLAARLFAADAAAAGSADPAVLAAQGSHPAWLVARWVAQFGAEAARQLLEWNQRPAPVYARWRVAEPVPDFLAPTRWPGFFEVGAGRWDDVRRLAAEGKLYVQDPSTRLGVDLVDPQPGETLLDACAAPGGKSLFLADRMGRGRVVALDAAAPAGRRDVRHARLKENLARAPADVQVAQVEADLRKVNPAFYRDLRLPESYDAVLLDAPCSNTGVMRHRVDVKWRLQEGDFARHAGQQLELLQAAARLVRPGGRLVYSTCSLDAAENEEVVAAFARSREGGAFRRERNVLAYPWRDGHDGAGAFLLRRA
ncbi:MAG: RsmB/NOP family class I SAM-dependent RNA methyltransferase [Opitutaceae bacterium]|nr:RsmB/NOP family class I SAM-dependent RNA methyltransferase [Opitutaceae bacterium]